MILSACCWTCTVVEVQHDEGRTSVLLLSKPQLSEISAHYTLTISRCMHAYTSWVYIGYIGGIYNYLKNALVLAISLLKYIH